MKSNTIKVTPGSRGNFSKLKKYKTGGDVKKYAMPDSPIELWYSDRYKNNSVLAGWNPQLNKSLAGASIYGNMASSLHSHAGDLQYAWGSNKAYTSNKALITSDIQHWYNEWIQEHPGATPQQAVDAYNAIAAQIRAYQTQGHSYNESGATTNNRNFKTLFHSRSIKGDNEDKSADNSFIGYQDNLEDVYGSSSFLRRMDQYEKKFRELTGAERDERLHTITNGDKSFIVYKKHNGDIGLLPADGNGDPGNGDPGNDDPGNGNPGGLGLDGDPRDVLEFPEEREPTPWTDWIPLSHLLANNYLNNLYQFQLEIKKKFPRVLPPRREAVVTDRYAERLEREKIASDVRSRANQQLTSDAITNLQILDTAENKALNLEDKNALAQTEGFDQTTKEVRQVADWNSLQANQYANENIKSDAAAFNNILNARKAKKDADTSNLNSWIGNMYASHGLWVLNQRLEDARYKKAVADYEYSRGLADLAETSGYRTLEERGIEASSALDALDSIINDENNPDYETYRMLQNLPTTKEEMIEWLNTPQTGDAELLRKKILNIYESEKNAAYRRYQLGALELAAKRDKVYIDLPDTFSNQGLYRNPFELKTSVLYHKQGARMARFYDYMEHYRKSLKQVHDVNMKAQKMLLDKLTRDLNAIDREQLLLIKSVFS